MNCVDAGNALVHLFLQTKTQYFLSNKKLQYLLIIAQMARLSLGQSLFDAEIRNVKTGFVLDEIADKFVSNSAIVEGKTNSMVIGGKPSDFVLPYTNKKIFAISSLPSEEEKRLLIDVFLSFGAFEEAALCKLLNQFKGLRNTPYFKTVEKDSVKKYIVDSLKANRYLNNPVFDFIKAVRAEQLFTSNAEEGTAVQTIAAVPPQAQMPGVLKNLTGVKSVIVGKQYTVFVEVPNPRCTCHITVTALKLNQHISGVLKRLTDTLYSFSFVSVASDIKISASIY